jgi:hypothetical protein
VRPERRPCSCSRQGFGVLARSAGRKAGRLGRKPGWTLGRRRRPEVRCYRIPASISGTSSSIVSGVTTPEPVLIESPVMPYFFDSTHWVTGRKPWR